jgi:hypothetical protein
MRCKHITQRGPVPAEGAPRANAGPAKADEKGPTPFPHVTWRTTGAGPQRGLHCPQASAASRF